MKFRFYLLFIMIAITGLPFETYAFHSNIGVITGYNDNVDATPDPEGAFFTKTYLNLSHQILHQKAFGESLLYLNASYKKYFGLSNIVDLSLGGHYSCFPLDGKLMTLGFVESGLFRDNEKPLDEFNWGKTGFQLKYYYSGRISFDYIQTFMGRSYLEQVEFIDETASDPIHGNGDSGTVETIIKEDQDDLLMSSDFGMKIHLAPWFTLHLSAMFNRLFPSIEEDAYNEGGASLSLTIVPKESWSLTMESSQLKKQFTNLDERDDTFTSSGLIINKIADNFEVFLSVYFMENSSTIYEESYKQQVGQCGISLFF